jgi:hypothetical protein
MRSGTANATMIERGRDTHDDRCMHYGYSMLNRFIDVSYIMEMR